MSQNPANQGEHDEVQTALAIARAYIQAGKAEQARLLLNRLLSRYPGNDAGWLMLLATNPPADEEIAALQGMLKHHPTHRFRPALEKRLNELLEEQRILGIIEQVRPVEQLQLPPRARLGDYLVSEGWVSQKDIDNALAEQRRLTELGMEARLGTVLLMQEKITVGELGVALGAVSAFELGTFGEYLVRNRVLAPVEVAAALAHQSLNAATLNKQYLRQIGAAGGVRRFLGSLMPTSSDQPYQRPPRLGDMLIQLGLLTPEEVEDHAQNAAHLKDAMLGD
jgi:hypothetical protein